MEALVDLLPLLFVGAYYLLAGRRRAKQKRVKAPQQELISDSEPREATPFQSFLSQIEEAMAEAAGEPVEAPEPEPMLPEPPPVSTPTVPDVAHSSPEFHPVSGSFDSLAAVDHERHGFGADNPISEEVFEQAPRFSEPVSRADRSYDPHDLRPSAPRPAPATPDWQTRLSDPVAAQHAFLLQTVFGPRGGRRAENRR